MTEPDSHGLPAPAHTDPQLGCHSQNPCATALYVIYAGSPERGCRSARGVVGSRREESVLIRQYWTFRLDVWSAASPRQPLPRHAPGSARGNLDRAARPHA